MPLQPVVYGARNRPSPSLRPKRVRISATLRSDEGELVTGADGT